MPVSTKKSNMFVRHESLPKSCWFFTSMPYLSMWPLIQSVRVASYYFTPKVLYSSRMTFLCSWQFTSIPQVYFSMPSSIILFQSFSSNTCLYIFFHCTEKLTYVYRLFISRCSFYTLIWLFPLTILLKNKLFFHIAQAKIFSSALFCPAPFHVSEFLCLQLCYKAILDTKPRHTVWRSTGCFGSL